MSILVSTQSYNNDEATPYGLLVEMNENTGSILRTLRIDTPVHVDNQKGRLKPGLRGLFEYQHQIYVATWNAVYIVSKASLEVENCISHEWMSDLHGIFVNQDGIWVTSSLPDALILYDFQGKPKASLWLSETFIYQPKIEVDKTKDWRLLGKDFRGFREYHANNVEVKDQYVYLTGRGENSKGRVMRFLKSDFINKAKLEDDDLELMIQGLYGPHDGTWNNGLYWVTETMNSSIAGINEKGKVIFRKKVYAKNEEKVGFNSLKDLLRTIKKRIKRKGGKMVTHWTRGLSVNQNNIFVGQSTWAGETSSRARIVKLDKSTKEVTGTFYLDIPDYPETRIYQVIHLESKATQTGE
jgi:hypothetical protein